MGYRGRHVLAYVLIALVVGIGIGIVIGFFALPKKACKSDDHVTDTTTEAPLPEGTKELWNQCEEKAELSRTCSPPLPRVYIATRKSGNLDIDGRLDDAAWFDVPWTEDFVDIRGVPPAFPAPDAQTKVKVTYDDTNLYVAARMQEDHVWATYTQKDSRIYEENAFEVFFDVDRSMSQYKEFEINALSTTWDLVLSRAYLDFGEVSDWEGIAEKAVYSDGGVNNISDPSSFWSTEVSFPFSALNQHTSRYNTTPEEGEVWFVTFARAEYETRENQTTGQYEKVPRTEASWWSWNPTGAVNLHLPNKWGLLYFTRQTAQEAKANHASANFPLWYLYYGLFHVFDVMQTFKALHGMFVSESPLLNFDPFIHDCFASFNVTVTNQGRNFEARLVTHDRPALTGHISQSRYVWITPMERREPSDIR